MQRAVDGICAGPLPEAVARSLAEHRVLQRVAREWLEAEEELGLDGAGLEPLAARLVESEAFRRTMLEVLSSEEVRRALTRQTAGFGEDVAAGARGRAGRA